MPGTPRLGLPYPAESASPDVPRDLLALATPLDGAVLFGSGTLANRPVSTALNPGVAGREYRATDDTTAGPAGTTWKDTGTGWETTILSSDPRLPAGTVTALPSSPVDGQEINFLADPTNGVVWRLRYRAGSSSAYKWEYVGGAALYSEAPNAGSPSNNNINVYAAIDIDWAGPRITIPGLSNGGEFDVEMGFTLDPNTSVVSPITWMSYAVSGTAALDGDAVRVSPGGSTQGAGGSFSRIKRKTFLGGATLTAQYKISVNNYVSIYARFLRVTPVRVG